MVRAAKEQAIEAKELQRAARLRELCDRARAGTTVQPEALREVRRRLLGQLGLAAGHLSPSPASGPLARVVHQIAIREGIVGANR